MSAHRHPLLWMLAPLIAWALHFVATYALVGLHCGAPPAWREWLPAAGLWTGVVLASAVAVGVIGWCAVDGLRQRRGAALVADPADPRAQAQRQRFQGTMQVLVAALALLAVAFTLLPTVLIEACP